MQLVISASRVMRLYRCPFPWRAIRAMVFLSCAMVLAGCNSELYDNLDQKQANEIVAALFRQGILAERVAGKGGKFAVHVDQSRFAEATAILKDQGLPKATQKTLAEVIGPPGIVPSPMQERILLMYGLSQELERTISAIDGVLEAHVLPVPPENDPLRQQAIPSSASVLIRHAANMAFTDLVPKIKNLVANSIPGLSYDKVSVVLVPVEIPEASLNTRPDQELVSFLGIWMPRSSLSRMVLVFFSLVGLVLLLGGALGFLLFNQRRRVYSLPSTNRAKVS